jgi:hypothetical protein
LRQQLCSPHHAGLRGDQFPTDLESSAGPEDY